MKSNDSPQTGRVRKIGRVFCALVALLTSSVLFAEEQYIVEPASISPVSLAGREFRNLQEVIETIDSITDRTVETPALSERFSSLLRALQVSCSGNDKAPACPPSLESLMVEVTREALVTATPRGRRLFSLERKPSRLARASVRELTRFLPPGERSILESTLWWIWMEAAVGLRDEPHDHFVYPENLNQRRATRRGKSFVPGITPRLDQGQIVIDTILDSHLAEDGLIEGSIITALDGHRGRRAIIESWLAAEPGSFNLEVQQSGGPHHFRSVRQPLRNPSLAWSRQGSVVYVRIKRFTRETLIELRRMARKIRNSPPKGVIIDLRSNPGGVTNFGVIDCFFKPGTPIVTIQGSEKKEPLTIEATFEYLSWPLAVLVDQSSASMAEVFTAAIKLHERGTIIGETTFGKAVSQSGFEIGGEGELWLVTHRLFYPGTAETWHERGIDPDEIVRIDDTVRQQVSDTLESPMIDIESHALEDPILARALEIFENEGAP